jgi:hypothetical protein
VADFEKKCAGLLIRCPSIIQALILWMKEIAVEFFTLYSECTMVTNLNLILRGRVLFNPTIVTEIQTDWNVQSEGCLIFLGQLSVQRFSIFFS